jgi:CBS domain containing-hemolysin-like protein
MRVGLSSAWGEAVRPLEHMEAGLSLAAVLALVAANGFFVATEFALVSVRRTRVEQLAAEGHASAHSVLDALNHLDAYIAATQLGITMASLALGWIGEPAFEHLLAPLVHAIPYLSPETRETASHVVSAAGAFIIITTLHIVLGELAPKSLALQRAEATALVVSRPIHVFLAVFRLPIMALNSVGNGVVRLFGIQPAAGHALVQSAEELKLAVAASREAGLLHEDAQQVVSRAFDFTELEAHDIMVPRPEIVAVPSDVSLDAIVETVERHQHSRYPVYEGSLDNIIGVVAAKRLLGAVTNREARAPGFDVRQHMSLPPYVPETIPGYRLLAELKRGRSHLAVVIDEYGVTAGLVTLRDLTGRLAGENPDETERVNADVDWLPGGLVVLDGLMRLSEVEERLGIPLDKGEFDTLGGLLFARLGRRPDIGDSIVEQGYRMTVEALDGLRITQVRLQPEEPKQEDTGAE